MMQLSKNSVNMVLISVLIVIAIAVSSIVFFYYESQDSDAYVLLSDGEVQVLRQGTTYASEVNMPLQEQDTIITKDGTATVVLYDSIIIELDPDTTITIQGLKEQHPQIKQEAGYTWNSFKHIAGVEEYTIQTPTTTATVRGTEFMVSDDEVITAEGTVIVNNQTVSEGERFDIRTKAKRKINSGEEEFVVRKLDVSTKKLEQVKSKLEKKEAKATARQKKTVTQKIQKIDDNIKKDKSRIARYNKQPGFSNISERIAPPVLERLQNISAERAIEEKELPAIRQIVEKQTTKEDKIAKIKAKQDRVKKIYKINGKKRTLTTQETIDYKNNISNSTTTSRQIIVATPTIRIH